MMLRPNNLETRCPWMILVVWCTVNLICVWFSLGESGTGIHEKFEKCALFCILPVHVETNEAYR